MNSFKKILQFAIPYKKDFLLNVFFNLLYSLMAIFSITSLIPVLKILLKGNEVSKQSVTIQPPILRDGFFERINYIKEYLGFWVNSKVIELGPFKAITYFCITVVVLFLLRNIFRYLGQYYMMKLRVNVAENIRTSLYSKILELPVAYFSNQRKGDLLNRVSADITIIENDILKSLTEFVRSPFMLITSIIALVLIDVKLTLFAFVVLPVMGFLISTLGKSLKRNGHKVQDALSNLVATVEETLNAVKIIKIFTAEKTMQNRFETDTKKWRNSSLRLNKKYELASPMSEFLGSVTLMMIFWYGGTLILKGQGMPAEAFLAYLGLFFQMLEPAKNLGKSISGVQKGLASGDRIIEILELPIPHKDKEEATKKESFDSEIEFKNIDFSYDGKNTVLEDFNLSINKGETVALVGHSGSGKSTIANLVARFYDVENGEVLIDGTNIKDIALKDYRGLLAMVTQDSVLFNDSVENNLKLSKPHATEKEIIEAAKKAYAHDFITELPNGYQTIIGDSGNKLSGGQKQRLNIARAILKDAPLLILDEATSALDTESEKEVQNALNQMMKDRTSIIIAHRLSTITHADKIIVMEKGEIIEQGPHNHLMQLNGAYKKLIDLQNLSYI